METDLKMLQELIVNLQQKQKEIETLNSKTLLIYSQQLENKQKECEESKDKLVSKDYELTNIKHQILYLEGHIKILKKQLKQKSQNELVDQLLETQQEYLSKINKLQLLVDKSNL